MQGEYRFIWSCASVRRWFNFQDGSMLEPVLSSNVYVEKWTQWQSSFKRTPKVDDVMNAPETLIGRAVCACYIGVGCLVF